MERVKEGERGRGGGEGESIAHTWSVALWRQNVSSSEMSGDANPTVPVHHASQHELTITCAGELVGVSHAGGVGQEGEAPYT